MQPPEVFYKKGVLKNVTKFTGTHLCQSFFFNKLKASGLQLYEKRDPGTGFFQWILWNFQEHLFCRRLRDDCFCLYESIMEISLMRRKIHVDQNYPLVPVSINWNFQCIVAEKNGCANLFLLPIINKLLWTPNQLTDIYEI